MGSSNNLDAGRRILYHWIALPGFNLGCRRWLGGDHIESIGHANASAISRARLADFIISMTADGLHRAHNVLPHRIVISGGEKKCVKILTAVSQKVCIIIGRNFSQYYYIMLSSFTANHTIVVLLISYSIKNKTQKSKTSMPHSPDAMSMAPGKDTE
jgi:hypothetical protein